MKSVALFLSGLTATLAGVSIRSCTQDFTSALARSWCGDSPPLHLSSMSHAHCAGCALAAAGVAMIAFTPILARLDARRRALSRAAT